MRLIALLTLVLFFSSTATAWRNPLAPRIPNKPAASLGGKPTKSAAELRQQRLRVVLHQIGRPIHKARVVIGRTLGKGSMIAALVPGAIMAVGVLAAAAGAFGGDEQAMEWGGRALWSGIKLATIPAGAYALGQALLAGKGAAHARVLLDKKAAERHALRNTSRIAEQVRVLTAAERKLSGMSEALTQAQQGGAVSGKDVRHLKRELRETIQEATKTARNVERKLKKIDGGKQALSAVTRLREQARALGTQASETSLRVLGGWLTRPTVTTLGAR